MKPFVVIKNQNDRCNVEFSMDELKKFIDEVYNCGYEDGRQANVYIHPYGYNNEHVNLQDINISYASTIPGKNA